MVQKTLVVVEHPLQQACHLHNLSKVIKLPLCNATSLLAKTITTISYPGCNFKNGCLTGEHNLCSWWPYGMWRLCKICPWLYFRSVIIYTIYVQVHMYRSRWLRKADERVWVEAVLSPVCTWQYSHVYCSDFIQKNNYIKTEIKFAFQMSLILNLRYVLKSTCVYGELWFTTRANKKTKHCWFECSCWRASIINSWVLVTSNVRCIIRS